MAIYRVIREMVYQEQCHVEAKDPAEARQKAAVLKKSEVWPKSPEGSSVNVKGWIVEEIKSEDVTFEVEEHHGKKLTVIKKGGKTIASQG